MSDKVKIQETTVTLPTYAPGEPDKNPMFLEKRINQGTSGRVYPNPFTDKLGDVKADRDYVAVCLENAYLQLMVLPQIGGRIHVGMDKTNGFDFIYRQHVVKPALIGLFGSWMSGGIEFNWPQHHRPSTFMPVHHTIEEHPDGSATVWLSEHDPLDRLKGMVGICLYPDKAFFEMKVQIYNRTPFVQTFLWWINVGVHVHDAYQVVFPQDVDVVTDHSKRSMSSYPIARGTYYGIDYGPETDISWYKNVPVSTSYFAYESSFDFFGGYDHRADAGIINVANHHISPGKKMFTWGTGESAKGWEGLLTDADGPYIELMAGVYTDNQPDFSWLQPYETKQFSQFWYPVQKIGPSKNANRHAAVNLEIANGKAKVGVAVTEPHEAATVLLTVGSQALLERTGPIAPGAPFVAEIAVPEGTAETALLLRVLDETGNELLRYAPHVYPERPLPEVKTPPSPPATFETTEELYLTGLHLEQYRHPTIEPEPYWEEALRRDPMDVRSNNAMGLSHFRRGSFAVAESYFSKAIDRLTRRNPNPRDGEPYFNLGMALRYQGRYDAAYAAFYKAIWSYAWQAPGYYALAELDGLRADWVSALDHIGRSLQTQTMNMKARNLKAAFLRRLGRLTEAAALCCETVALDPLDMMSRNEIVLQSRAQGKSAAAESQLAELRALTHVSDPLVEVQNAFDMAYDYANAGLWEEASDVLSRLDGGAAAPVFPMVLYALGYFADRLGHPEAGQAYYRRASSMSTDYCFPVRLEEQLVLEHARSVFPEDPRIAYYLGNLYYDKKRYDEAIAAWELAVKDEPDFSIPWRNLGIAYYNVRHASEQAVASYERAFATNPRDGRVLGELDQLRQRTGVSPADRLALLEAHMDLVRDRDDLSVEIATLYNQVGQPQKSLDYMLARQFHPWEGGTGRISAQFVRAHYLLGMAALERSEASLAREHFEAALGTYPSNLGERRGMWASDAHVRYALGLAERQLGDEAAAEASFRAVLEAREGFAPVAYYQALALRELGDRNAADEKLRAMLKQAQERLEAQVQRGFATSVPQFVFAEDDMQSRMRTHLTYFIGMAHLGLGELAEARAAFESVLEHEPYHTGALDGLRGL